MALHGAHKGKGRNTHLFEGLAWCLADAAESDPDSEPRRRNRPGPERREVKLRQRWRRKDDSMRPTGMKGAAHRGGGAAKRRDKSRDIGHNGGALARAQRREKAKARGKKRRVRVVVAARQTTAGQVSLSLSSVTQAVSSVRKAPGVVAPALSAFMARAQASANRMFTF